ncbi:hypothetical protein PCL1606_16480 [Pseudomonas chlororaphis]|uniref:Uncharacterized protein n=1 Tax=Pseudomonas chlororaphis TaxID=587753 RepID=A0A0D5XVI7_9PSED|nr:hypothetical protein PCL1606_16480 [Pseudomonas chlororaphis]
MRQGGGFPGRPGAASCHYLGQASISSPLIRLKTKSIFATVKAMSTRPDTLPPPVTPAAIPPRPSSALRIDRLNSTIATIPSVVRIGLFLYWRVGSEVLPLCLGSRG